MSERKRYYWRFNKYPCARKRYLSKYRTFGFQLWRVDTARHLDIWLGSRLYAISLNWYWEGETE